MEGNSGQHCGEIKPIWNTLETDVSNDRNKQNDCDEQNVSLNMHYGFLFKLKLSVTRIGVPINSVSNHPFL